MVIEYICNYLSDTQNELYDKGEVLAETIDNANVQEELSYFLSEVEVFCDIIDNDADSIVENDDKDYLVKTILLFKKNMDDFISFYSGLSSDYKSQETEQYIARMIDISTKYSEFTFVFQ